MPKVFASRVKRGASPALRSRALVGIQPTFRQTPPQYFSSTTATRLPSWAARMAATYPPGPAPSTTTSKRSPCSSMDGSFPLGRPASHESRLVPDRTTCSRAPTRRRGVPPPPAAGDRWGTREAITWSTTSATVTRTSGSAPQGHDLCSRGNASTAGLHPREHGLGAEADGAAAGRHRLRPLQRAQPHHRRPGHAEDRPGRLLLERVDEPD